MARGRIQQTGGPELADELEVSGYAAWAEDEPVAAAADPLADPFADPLA